MKNNTDKYLEKNSKYWNKRTLERYSGAELEAHKTSKQIEQIYKQALRNVRKELNSIYRQYAYHEKISVKKLKQILSAKETGKLWKNFKKKGYERYLKENFKYRITRAEQLQAQLYMQMMELFPKELKAQKKLYTNILYNNYYKAIYDVQKGLGIEFDFNKLSSDLVETVLSKKWSDKNYSERIYRNIDNFSDKIAEIIGGGLLSGTSSEKMSNQIKQAFKISKYYSDRLVRTETNYFCNQADLLSSLELGLDQYVFMSVLDSRTSKICQEHDGKRYCYKDIKVGYNYPPLHPNCRSVTRAFFGEEEERNLERRARNPITGKNEIIKNMSYKQWAKKNDLLSSKKE